MLELVRLSHMMKPVVLFANTYKAFNIYVGEDCGSGMRNMHGNYGLEVRLEDYGD